MRLSRASAMSVRRFSTISRAETCASEGLGGEVISGGKMRGDWPKRRWKGEYPVDLLIEVIM